MTRSILVIAPHPDDETFGCGGAMMRARDEGADVTWLIVTSVTESCGYSADYILSRSREIRQVASALGVTRCIELGYPTARLDTLPKEKLIGDIGVVVKEARATEIYMPFRRDIHSDHMVVFDAGAACSKWFRYPSVKRVLAYETPSETDFDISPDSTGFRPNVFLDITKWLEQKTAIAKVFDSEIGVHPFPRSVEMIRALATIRGAASGFFAAEAFMLLRERID